MSYFDYRGFIRGKIKEVCPDAIEHKDAFNRDNIDANTTNDGFHILPESISSTPRGVACGLYEDQLNIDLQLMSCGGRYVTDAVDDALKKAVCIRGKLVDISQFPIDNTLERVEVTQTTINPEPTNDNAVIINMSLILHLNYCVEC